MGSQWAELVSGMSSSYTATVTADDLVTFVRLSGDDYEAHTDPDFMARSSFRAVIAHGALLVGYMSAAGTKLIRLARSRGNTTTPVSLGYDRMRFVAPVFLGDTVKVSYRIKSVDVGRGRSVADIEVVNQSGVVVAVGEHVMKWVKSDAV